MCGRNEKLVYVFFLVLLTFIIVIFAPCHTSHGNCSLFTEICCKGSIESSIDLLPLSLILLVVKNIQLRKTVLKMNDNEMMGINDAMKKLMEYLECGRLLSVLVFRHCCFSTPSEFVFLYIFQRRI